MGARNFAQAGRRSQRECPICNRTYYKLTDHLKKTHNMKSREEREPYMREAFAKTPDLRIQSEYYLVLHDMHHRGVLRGWKWQEQLSLPLCPVQGEKVPQTCGPYLGHTQFERECEQGHPSQSFGLSTFTVQVRWGLDPIKHSASCII